MRRRRGWVALLLLAATACSGATKQAASPPPPPGSDLRQVQLTATDLISLATADNGFGTTLLDRLVAESHGGNLVLSPASIATALQMAFAGAKGSTAVEMARSLGVDGQTPQQVAAAASRLLQRLRPLAHDPDETLDLTNDVWVQSGFNLTSAYDAMMRSGFDGGLHRVDFVHHPGDAVDAVNAAVATATANRIKDLIARDEVDRSTRLILTNAVYLKARWATPFVRTETKDRPYFLSADALTKVPTMATYDHFDYAQGDGYQAVRLPYAGGRLVMTVVLPAPDAMHSVRHLGAFHDRQVDLWLPKFSFTWSDELSGTLQAMGMRTAFEDTADFSGMSTQEPLHIAFVQHKAFIKVDEDGTEAAAATGVGIAASGALAPSKPVTMHVDRPFFFTISDTQTGLTLFAGHVTNPAATTE